MAEAFERQTIEITSWALKYTSSTNGMQLAEANHPYVHLPLIMTCQKAHWEDGLAIFRRKIDPTILDKIIIYSSRKRLKFGGSQISFRTKTGRKTKAGQSNIRNWIDCCYIVIGWKKPLEINLVNAKIISKIYPITLGEAHQRANRKENCRNLLLHLLQKMRAFIKV